MPTRQDSLVLSVWTRHNDEGLLVVADYQVFRSRRPHSEYNVRSSHASLPGWTVGPGVVQDHSSSTHTHRQYSHSWYKMAMKFLLHCIVCNAVFLIIEPSVCLCVCHTHELWQNELKFCWHSYTIWKESSYSFLDVNNGWWRTPSSTWNFGSNWPTQLQKRWFSIDIRSYRLNPYN